MINKITKKFVLFLAIICLAIGALIGVYVSPYYSQVSGSDIGTPAEAEESPLYWVAPMDANYRRDQPGKSPMGMDLVPVYANDSSNNQGNDAGVVTISPSVENNIGVRLGKAFIGRLNPQINSVGYVTYNEDKLVHVHPRIEGWVEKLYVKATGEQVKKDQPLYKLYSPELVNAQEEYLLALKSGETRLINGAENKLLALQVSSQAIAALKKSKQVQQHVTFYAPQSGIIENLKIREGFFVQPGDTLFSIGDLSEVWVEAEVFERQAYQVQAGDQVNMSLSYFPNKQWQGQVDYIYPTLDASTRTVRVRMRFANQNTLLKPNMFAQVQISTQAKNEQLLIPKEAVIRTGKQNRVVLALGAGQFKSVAVDIAGQDDKHIAIAEGLENGDDIVISAQFLIDSESSKSSDFMRMSVMVESAMVESAMADMNHAGSHSVSSARVTGVINSLNSNARVANISRGAIAKWERPAATMDFSLAESVDMSLLTTGLSIDFTFEIRDGEFIVTALHLNATELDASSTQSMHQHH